MSPKFRDEDILMFLYDEMPPETCEVFLDALTKDDGLWEKYEYFQSVIDQLGTVSYEPSEMSTQKIMAAVAEDSNSSQRSKLAGFFPSTISMGLVVATFLVLFFTKGIIGTSSNYVYTPVLAQERTEIVQETQSDAQFEWDDDELGSKIEAIEERTKNMFDEPLL